MSSKQGVTVKKLNLEIHNVWYDNKMITVTCKLALAIYYYKD